MSNILQNLGQLFIIGFSGRELTTSFLDFLGEEQIGGVLLLGEACATHDLTRKNIEKINSVMSGTRPFVAVDQEGGRICRLRGAPVEYHAAAEYADRLGLEKFAEDYHRSALYMQSLGINMNLAETAGVPSIPYLNLWLPIFLPLSSSTK